MADPGGLWRNRIVGYANVNPAELVEHPLNYRKHPRTQQDALSGLIDELGYLDPVIVQAGTNIVVNGHLRRELALDEKQATIPVAYVDLSDEETRLALASIDPISALAQHDAARLEALLAGVSTQDQAIAAMLDDLAERSGVIPPHLDPSGAWVGMPAFHQDDLMPIKQVIVSFADAGDVERFAALIEQDVTMTTRSVWYPKQERQRPRELGYVEGESIDAA